SEDPEVVRQRLQDVVEIEIPDQYNPLVTTAMDLIVFRMRLFVYERADGDGQLLLIEANRPLAEMRSGIEPQMRQAIPQDGQQPRELTITESEERQFEIRGQTVSFTFAKGTDANSGEEF